MAGWLAGWLVGWILVIIMPLRGPILQAEICKIFSWAEIPRWGRVWQYSLHSVINHLGENTQSGHYNLVLFDSETKKCILLDDSTISYADDSQEEMKTLSYICIYLSEKCNT